MRLLTALFSVCLLVCAAFAAPAFAEKRVALVIGNSAYRNTAALPNPVNDSEDIAAALKKVGFTVLLERNLDKHSMENAVARFARLAQDADAALFYYAGHGMQYRGSNYLVPVDAKLEDEFKLTFELTRLDDVLFGLERARGVKILILDACRNNPLADRLTQTATSRDLVPTRGLAKIEANRGMVIAYSTQANQIAVDGTGRNSPFTAALVKEIDEPGIEIGALFRRVAADVNQMTDGRQLPELSVSLVGDFYLNAHDTDLQAWTKLKGANDPRRLKIFISQYPNSPLASEAQDRLAALDRGDKARAEDAQRAQAVQAERDRIEKERLAKEQAERERLEQEQLAAVQAERERLAREQAERDRGDAEQVKREAAKREEAERDNAAAEKPALAIPAATEPGTPPAQTAMLTPSAAPAPPKAADVLSGGALIQAIKKELKRLGCYEGRVDNNWNSSETKSSVRQFAKFAKLDAAPDVPETDLLEILRTKSGRVCPLECGAREVQQDGRCVARTCSAGEVLSAHGCQPRKDRTSTAVRTAEPSRRVSNRNQSVAPRRKPAKPPAKDEDDPNVWDMPP